MLRLRCCKYFVILLTYFCLLFYFYTNLFFVVLLLFVFAFVCFVFVFVVFLVVFCCCVFCIYLILISKMDLNQRFCKCLIIRRRWKMPATGGRGQLLILYKAMLLFLLIFKKEGRKCFI